MTKRRAPLSFENGLTRIAAHLGWEAMGAAIGKAPRTVMDYSDPDTSTGVGLADAYLLTQAYRLAGGDGDPLGDCWRAQLKCAERDACGDTLHNHFVTVIKESAEATAALAHATRPGATPTDRAIARRELEESISAQTSTLAHLSDGAGPEETSTRAVPGGDRP